MLLLLKILAAVVAITSILFFIAPIYAAMIISSRISRLEEEWAREKHSS